MRRSKPASSVAILGALVCCATLPAHAGKLRLTATQTTQPIQIDGQLETAWQAAKPLTVRLDELTYKPSTGYPGIKETDVEVRSLYDADNVYFVFKWEDPTQSQARWPWVKQQDGTWQQQSNLDSTGNENFHYEDKLTVAWNISEKGFAKKGCEQSCHMVDNGKIYDIPDNSAGRHFTAAPGQTVDVWHWKSARTAPVGRADDQYFDHSHNENKEWGRKSDENTGGGYKDNIPDGMSAPVTQLGSTPKWMNGNPNSTDKFWIRDEDKVAFVDTFKPGDVIAGVITQAYLGSRADVSAKGVWQDGYWTVEVQRKRNTTAPLANEQDVQFDELGKVYHLGVAIYDNSQINHFYHPKAIEYRFAE